MCTSNKGNLDFQTFVRRPLLEFLVVEPGAEMGLNVIANYITIEWDLYHFEIREILMDSSGKSNIDLAVT